MTSRLDERYHLFRSVNGSAFCPATMTLFTKDRIERRGNAVMISNANYETVHETYHWATTCYTSAGLLLSIARYARMKLVLDLFDRIGPTRVSKELTQSNEPLLPRFAFDRLTEITHPENDDIASEVCNIAILHAFEKMILYGSETVPFFRSGGQHFHPIQLTLRASELIHFEYDRHRTGAHSADIFSDGASQELGAGLRRQFGFASAGPGKGAVDTIDLFEAFSVVADISAACSQGDAEGAEERLRKISGTSYIVAIEAILTRLGVSTSVDGIWTHWPTIYVILEVALNPPCAPLVDLRTYRPTWSMIYPPLRAVLATNVAKSLGELPTNQSDGAAIDAYYGAIKERLDHGVQHFGLPLSRRGPSFFASFERGRPGTQSTLRWDWFDVVLEIFESFQNDLSASNRVSLSAMVMDGTYMSLKRAYPPAIIFEDGELGYQSQSNQLLAEQWLVLMAVWFGLEDIAHGARSAVLSPFRSELTARKDWYLDACAAASLQMKNGLGVDVEFV